MSHTISSKCVGLQVGLVRAPYPGTGGSPDIIGFRWQASLTRQHVGSTVYESPDVNISKQNTTIVTGDTFDRPQGLACKLRYSLIYLHQNLSRQPSESLFLGTPPWEGDYLASKVDCWVKVCNTINTSLSSMKLRMALISRSFYYWNWECCLRLCWW